MGELYDCQESVAFTRQAEKLDAGRRDLDDLLEGVEWALARNPFQFQAVGGDRYVIGTKRTHLFAPFSIIFSVDELKGLVRLDQIITAPDD